jgi:membrane protein YdbS with pleckstrin-like domain
VIDPAPDPPTAEPDPPTAEPVPLDTPRRLDPRVRIVWMVEGIVGALVLGVGAAAAAIGGATLLAGVVAAVAVVLLVATAVSTHLRYRRWWWAAGEEALEIRRGVVLHQASFVPYQRIQQIDLHRGPVDRLVGLTTLILRTAAATTDATIPGVAAEEAEALRHRLLARAGIDDAV